MKKLLLLVLLCVVSVFSSYAQLKAPVQVDTLRVVSMQYNFNAVDRQNWPFDKVIRTAERFVFGNQTAVVAEAHRSGYSSEYRVDGIRYRMKDDSNLYQYPKGKHVYIEYAGYILDCIQSGIYACDVHCSVRVSGRQIMGGVPRPKVDVFDEGQVVVSIWVDQYGAVVKALIDESTTLSDENLLRAAMNSAMGIHFTVKTDAEKKQQGTVTYTFSEK